MKQLLFWMLLMLVGGVLENCRADAARTYRESRQPLIKKNPANEDQGN
ncbi:hypothetical protein [Pseudobacteroides cellulosolvens]|nr:hypothetical protein [Pseudobacteroides cellulosolvens]